MIFFGKFYIKLAILEVEIVWLENEIRGFVDRSRVGHILSG